MKHLFFKVLATLFFLPVFSFAQTATLVTPYATSTSADFYQYMALSVPLESGDYVFASGFCYAANSGVNRNAIVLYYSYNDQATTTAAVSSFQSVSSFAGGRAAPISYYIPATTTDATLHLKLVYYNDTCYYGTPPSQLAAFVFHEVAVTGGGGESEVGYYDWLLASCIIIILLAIPAFRTIFSVFRKKK